MKSSVALLIAALGIAAPQAFARDQHAEGQHLKMNDDHSRSMAASMSPGACRGFVILPNGYAVLSGISDPADHRGATRTHQGVKTESESGHDASMAQTGKDHLMGLRHGDAIEVQPGWLCVPVEENAATQWTAMSSVPSLHVSAKSLRGTLAHNSRANEGFEITISENSKPIGDAAVRVVARMPHHDKNLAGGHGPANDPDARGMATKAGGKGRYILNNVDFNMGGPWLFEVQVKRGSKSSRAYFAANVGQE